MYIDTLEHCFREYASFGFNYFVGKQKNFTNFGQISVQSFDDS